jgi:imidazoleglycerol phosphate synthase glutamine amidotransferase subunit HisH
VIALLDCGTGNVGSVLKAIEYLGRPATIANSPDALARAERLVFPGQGHFGAVMKALADRRLLAPLRGFITEGKPFFGICLGLQILYETSEEAPAVAGLGILPGRVRRFQGVFKVPHVGWSQLEIRQPACARFWRDSASRRPGSSERRRVAAATGRRPSSLFQGVENGSFVYYCHSYYGPVTEQSSAVTEYGVPFAAGVEANSLWAVQFHPEKSGEVGLRVLRNFLQM